MQALYLSELKNAVLIAVYDLDCMQGPVFFDVAAGGESFNAVNEREIVLKENDIFMYDAKGISGEQYLRAGWAYAGDKKE